MAARQALEALRESLQNLAGNYSLEIDGLSGESSDKLGWLKSSGRDFLNLTTAAAKQAVLRYATAAVERARASHSAIRLDEFVTVEGGRALKSVVLLRFREQGNDISLRPLSPAYRAWKGAHGYDTRIGIRTGTLWTELMSADFRLVKR